MARHLLQADNSVFMIIDLQVNLMKVMDQAGKVYKNMHPTPEFKAIAPLLK